MSIDVSRLPELIRNKKRQVRARIGDVEALLAHIEADLLEDIEEIARVVFPASRGSISPRFARVRSRKGRKRRFAGGARSWSAMCFHVRRRRTGTQPSATISLATTM